VERGGGVMGEGGAGGCNVRKDNRRKNRGRRPWQMRGGRKEHSRDKGSFEEGEGVGMREKSRR